MTPRVLIEPARLAGSSVLRCQTDDRLVDLVRAGNVRAFEAIVDRYRRPLVRYCARMLPPARAEDAVQQAFLNAFAGLRRDERHIELRPWLYRIAHNAALNAVRENGWGHEGIEVAVHRVSGESAHEAAERRASLRTVLAAVQELPERQRDAVILRELEGRTYEQIAIELDATGGAVRQLLNRARHTLRAGATALTPAGLFARLPWGSGGPAAERIAEAASHEGLRAGAGRIGGALAASIAVAVGFSAGVQELPRVAPDPPARAHDAAPQRAAAPRLVAAVPRGPVPRLVPAGSETLPRLSRDAPAPPARPGRRKAAPSPASPASTPVAATAVDPRAASAPVLQAAVPHTHEHHMPRKPRRSARSREKRAGPPAHAHPRAAAAGAERGKPARAARGRSNRRHAAKGGGHAPGGGAVHGRAEAPAAEPDRRGADKPHLAGRGRGRGPR